MEINQITELAFQGFLQEPLVPARHGDKLIRLDVSRNTLIAFALSLLIHVLILFLAAPHMLLDNASAPPRVINVSLAPPSPSAKTESSLQERPLEKTTPKVVKSTQKVMTKQLRRNEKPSFSVPEAPAPKPTPEIAPPRESVAKDSAKDAPTDMMAYVNARRAARQASESYAAQQNAEAVARETGPSESQARDERIKRNLQSGTNGIFEITSLSGRSASFAFRGWTNDYSTSRRQFFEVEASTGQDVRLVMIRKMIGLIRDHYQGDFNWDSRRLQRVVPMSARPADNAALEDFMMMEFFGPNYKNSP